MSDLASNFPEVVAEMVLDIYVAVPIDHSPTRPAAFSVNSDPARI